LRDQAQHHEQRVNSPNAARILATSPQFPAGPCKINEPMTTMKVDHGSKQSGEILMKKLIAAALVAGGTLAASAPAALAQGYVYGYPSAPAYVAPGYAAPGYVYAPGYAAPLYDYAPGYWGYGSNDESGNSYRQPSPRSTIRAVR
jgi:hypothetical protein